MPMDTTEKRFECDIESFFVSPAGGYTKTTDTYDPKLGLYVGTLINFIIEIDELKGRQALPQDVEVTSVIHV